jgi:hypothetical protein
MKRSLSMIFLLTAIFAFASGCATREYVREQVSPLEARIIKLEVTVASLDQKNNFTASELGRINKEVNDIKMTAKDCCVKADLAAARGEEAARRSEAAATKAEAAAMRAEDAAAKAQKAFELQQKK